jgi:exoribonuclease II
VKPGDNISESEEVTTTNTAGTPAAEAVRAGLQSARKKAFQELRGDVQIKSLPDILKKNDALMNERYLKPLGKWSKEVKIRSSRKLEKDKGGSSSKKKNMYTAEMMFRALGEPKTSLKVDDLFEPLDLGDAVELSSSLNQSVLAVIVAVPSSFEDPRYSVMTRLGELQFLEKSAFKSRIPRVIPREWLKNIINRVNEPDADYGSIKPTPRGFSRFTVNPLARQIISQPLIDLTNSAWSKIQQTSRKLEIIHRLLETNGPREVSLLTLMKAVNELSLKTFEQSIKDNGVIMAYKQLREEMAAQASADFRSGLNSPILGKEYGMISRTEEYDIALLYSVMLVLRKQTMLWSTQNKSRSAFMPLSVTILPMNYTTRLTSVVQQLKNPDENVVNQFDRYVKGGKFDDLPDSLREVFFLLKEYAVGNIIDPISETVICQLMKTHSDSTVTRTLVWDFLVKCGYLDPKMVNPQHFTTSLAFPGKNVSMKADLEEEFFQFCDVDERAGEDRAKSRVDLTGLNVYCIDSATAHEIDDGVSVEHLNDVKAKLHIHIADPTSYLQSDSTMMKIAFERAFTTYQPETISAMFPRSMSELAGLGVNGRKTRAMTFSIEVDKRTGVVDFATAQANATLVSKFPKYTYNDVDQALSQLDISREEHRELKSMNDISVLLRANRVQEGAVVYPDSLSVQVRIQPQSTTQHSDTSVDDEAVQFDGQRSTPSVVLVTEFMILANRIAATILRKRGLPGVFKTMPSLALEGSAAHVVPRLNQLSKSQSMELSDMIRSFKFVTPAVYSHSPGSHLMLGVDGYAPSTSPLRRFGDVVNHIQLHADLNGEPHVFSRELVMSMVLHIEARNDILKKAARGALAYYSMKTLQEQINNGTLSSRFIVVSQAVNNVVNGLLLEFGVFGKMRLKENRQPPYIGDIIPLFEVVELDPVGQNLVVKEV